MASTRAEFDSLRRECFASLERLRAALQESERDLRNLKLVNSPDWEDKLLQQRGKEAVAWRDYLVAVRQVGAFLHRQNQNAKPDAE